MKNFVKESRILRRKDLNLSGDRKYREFEVAGAEEFAAGQYLMIRVSQDRKEIAWPEPYFIHEKTAEGLVVLAREDQDLYLCGEEDGVEFWGPRGTSPLGEEKPVLVTEPAVYFAVYPFVCEKAYKKVILVGAEGEVDAAALESVEYCSDAEEAARKIEAEAGAVVAALNPVQAEAFSAHLSGERKASVHLLITNKKACGIDGCKGCYIHSKDLKFGVNVCCQGPFMPLNIVDFEADRLCFESYL